MHAFASNEFRDFFYGPEDHEKVRRYLEIDHDERQAEKMSARALSEKNLTDGESATQIERRQTEIRTLFREKRLRIIESMNYNTVLALGRNLNLIDLVAGRANITETVVSPQTSPIVDRLREILHTDWLESFPAEKERVSKILEEADQRTNVERPSLACTLDEALRYASNSPNASWDALQNAFIGLLRHTPLPARADEMAASKHQLGVRIDESAKKVKMLAKFKDIHLEPSNPTTNEIELRAEQENLEKFTSQLATLDQIYGYRKKFSPGKRVPPSVALEVKMTFDHFWNHTGIVQEKPCFKKKPKTPPEPTFVPVGFVYNEPMLAWIVTEFSAFWQKHRKHYEKSRTTTAEKGAPKSATDQENGKKGVLVREGNRWLDRTKSFVESLGNQTFPNLTQDELKKRIKTFSRDHKIKDPRTTKKVQEFFGTILTKSKQKPSSEILCSIQEILRSCEIENVSVTAISECLSLLGVAHSSEPKKVRKKIKR